MTKLRGIYILNVEQPEYCAKCFAFDAETCECNLGVNRTCNPFDGRYDRCPVFPVTGHGRLVEADAVKELLSRTWVPDSRPGAGFFVSEVASIESVPTIIPASEEGE